MDSEINHPNSPPPENSAALKIVIIYEDFSSGLRAKHFAQRLAKHLGQASPLANSLWRSELLDLPVLAAEAARAAADCDYLIVSLRGDRPLPYALRHWLNASLDGAAARGTALIALVNFAGGPGRAEGGARHHLRFLCADKGIEFFSHSGTLPDDAAAPELLRNRRQPLSAP